MRSQAWSQRDGAKLTGTWRLHPCKPLMLMVFQSSWEIKAERKRISEFSKHTSPAREGRPGPLPVLSGLQIQTCLLDDYHQVSQAKGGWVYTHCKATILLTFLLYHSCLVYGKWGQKRNGLPAVAKSFKMFQSLRKANKTKSCTRVTWEKQTQVCLPATFLHIILRCSLNSIKDLYMF